MAFNVSASIWESDVNVSNNTSVVHVRVNITSSGESHSYNNLYGTITIDGNDYSHGAYQVPYNANLTFESTRTITHNADGAKSVNWSYSFQVKSKDTRTGSGSITLTTIARASQPSCITYPNTTQNIGNVGDTIKIHMNRKSTNFKHTVTYTLGSKSGTIATNVTDNCDWTIPLDLANYITNSKSGNGTIYAETFNGTTSIGKKSVSFTVNIPNTATFKPTMSLSVTPSGQFKSKYLNKVSGVTVSATTGGKYNATIYSYSISGLSKTASKANLVVNPINENLTNASQSFTISGSVTDSRGYTNTASTSITVYRYNAPQITQYSVQRCTSDGTVSNSGTYAKVGITYKYQNDGYSNTMPTKKININNTDYNLTTTETTSNGVVTGTGYTVVGGGNLAITNKYNYTITCIDEVGKSITSQGVLNTSERIFSIRPQGKGIAFGMFATTDSLVESAWKIKSTNGFEGNASSATNATNATNVNVLSTTLASGTNYYPLFSTGTGNQRARANTSYKIPHNSGTFEIQRAKAMIIYDRATMSNLTAWGAGKALTTVESSKTIGSGLTISNGQIVVNNSTIKKVKITASIGAYRNTSTGDTGARIRKNNDTNVLDIAYSSYNSAYQYWTPGNSVTLLYDVSQNDKINIWVWSGAASSVEYLKAVLLVEDVTEY